MAQQRIQKVLAQAGFGSRRACETLVTEGRVRIDGDVVTDLPILVDPDAARITVDGKPVRSRRFVYYLLNKPKGYFCTNSDPDGRRRAIDLMVGVRERVYPVGRLDAETTGLLLMTNDGALAQKLTHPRFGTPKTYRAEVRGKPEAAQLDALRKGVWLADGKSKPVEISIVHASRTKSVLEITVGEVRNQEIRRLLARIGHPIQRLTRIKMGRLSIKRVPLGGFRALTASEVQYLQRLAEGVDEEMKAPSRPLKKRSKHAPRPSSAGRTKDVNDRVAPLGSGTRKTSGAARRSAARGPAPEKQTALPAGGGRKKRRVILPE